MKHLSVISEKKNCVYNIKTKKTDFNIVHKNLLMKSYVKTLLNSLCETVLSGSE